VVSKKLIEDYLSRVEETATKSTYKLDVGFERCEVKRKESAPKFIPRSTYHKVEATIKSTKTHYPSNPKPSFNPKREVRKETLKLREEVFVCMFCGYADHLDEFCFRRRRIEKRLLSMLETHVVMSSLIFCLILIIVLRPVHLLVLCLVSLMDLTIAHMVLIHERTTLCLDTLVIAHVLIMLIVPRVGMIFLLEGFTPTLSPDTWMVHIFSVLVLVPLVQRLRCKRQ
jgi:hypothetical protein